MPVPIVGSSDDLSTGPESVGHILGRLAYQYGQTLETKKPAPKGGRLGAIIVPATLTGVFAVVAVFSLVLLLTEVRFASTPGSDFAIYHDAAARWLAGGPFYNPEQVAGPYTTIGGDVMYPPVGLLLFVPFVYLPGLLWWVVPIAIVVWRIVALRPSRWGWVGIAACLAWPITPVLLVTGNPTIWVAAALALATRWPAFGVLVLVKPSLFPFAFGGVRTRQWWIGLGAFALASALFLPMWTEWIHAVLNARGPFSGVLYSIKDVPMMLIPTIAWFASTRRSWPRASSP